MKTLFSTLLAIVTFSFFAFSTPIDILTVDTAASELKWKGYKVTGNHEGTISVKEGQLLMEDGQLTGGSFTIDINSMTCTDLQGGMADKLLGHLKSDDFFGAATYPEAKFEITKVASRGTEGAFKVYGDLTIKGTTKEVRFNTQLTEEDGNTIAVADLEIDRTDYGLKYGSGSFIDNLGDKTIYDEFELGIRLVAKK